MFPAGFVHFSPGITLIGITVILHLGYYSCFLVGLLVSKVAELSHINMPSLFSQ